MWLVAVRIFVISLAFAPGLVFAVDPPECNSEEIQDEWENHEERLLEGINTHVKEVRRGNSSYIGYADLACFTEHYLYLYIESEREREERVRTLMKFGANESVGTIPPHRLRQMAFLVPSLEIIIEDEQRKRDEERKRQAKEERIKKREEDLEWRNQSVEKRLEHSLVKGIVTYSKC